MTEPTIELPAELQHLTGLEAAHYRIVRLIREMKAKRIRFHDGITHEGWTLFVFGSGNVQLSGKLSGFRIDETVVTESGYSMGTLPQEDEKLTAILLELFQQTITGLEKVIADPYRY